jgi:helicase MOV-10
VRSSRDFIQYDLRHTLGFVANPRRFNGACNANRCHLNSQNFVVAVTRAKALLLVIGDPAVLSLDPLWRAFLNYIHRNGGWKGQPITWDPSAPVEEDGKYDQAARHAAEVDMNELSKLLESMALEGVEEADDAANAELNVDKPWRELE